ncbi:MAG: APC family permease, partial [Actinobacteria bacterium]|nr:APC family permease [Actinomycetota bacterium]
AVYFSEETRGASRGIARAIMWSLAITVAAELIPMTAVLLGAPNLTDLLKSPTPMQYFVTARGSHALNTAISLGIAIAIINATVAITLQAGRTVWASARDRAYPDPVSRVLGYVHPKLQTPMPATLLVGLAAAVVASVVSLNSLIVATGATLVVLYVLVALSAIVGRANGKTAHARYKMPAWPLAPVLVIAALGYVSYELWKANPWQIIIALIALGVGYLYYFGYLYARRAERWTMPDALLDDEEASAPDALAEAAQPIVHPDVEAAGA